MSWTKKDYPDSMKNLDNAVRNKAIEIANELEKDNYEEGRAISIAISQAKKWNEDRGGETSSDITHHLVSDGDKWVLKPTNQGEETKFDT